MTIVITAMVFAAALEANGIIDKLVSPIKHHFKKDKNIIVAAGALSVVTNMLTADQYVGISMPYKFVAEEFEASGLEPSVMSSTLEGAGTVSSALIP
jgi:NhaC family Na+:H+ antiporter